MSTEILPNGLVYVSHNAGAGSYDKTTGLWTVGNLNVGSNVTLVIVVRVNATGNTVNVAGLEIKLLAISLCVITSEHSYLLATLISKSSAL